MSGRSTDPQILVVEDSSEDLEVLRRGLRHVPGAPRLIHAATAEEALGLLSCSQNGPIWPLLVLLDLNLPTTSGFDLLHLLKVDPTLQLLPVVVLSGSAQEEDVSRAYRLGAAGYIVKPFGAGAADDLVDRLLGYWQHLVRLPTMVVAQESRRA